jgi:predicted GIY-YIG superfamily endonuclease
MSVIPTTSNCVSRSITLERCPVTRLTRRPLALVFSQEFVTREEALAAERQLKGWSRAKKEALVREDWVAINRLGRGKHRHQRE